MKLFFFCETLCFYEHCSVLKLEFCSICMYLMHWTYYYYFWNRLLLLLYNKIKYIWRLWICKLPPHIFLVVYFQSHLCLKSEKASYVNFVYFYYLLSIYLMDWFVQWLSSSYIRFTMNKQKTYTVLSSKIWFITHRTRDCKINTISPTETNNSCTFYAMIVFKLRQ